MAMYFKSMTEADQIHENINGDGCCFGCGKEIDGDVVRYDGYATYGMIKGLFLHPACAALVGQRLVCDGFPRRHPKNSG